MTAFELMRCTAKDCQEHGCSGREIDLCLDDIITQIAHCPVMISVMLTVLTTFREQQDRGKLDGLKAFTLNSLE